MKPTRRALTVAAIFYAVTSSVILFTYVKYSKRRIVNEALKKFSIVRRFDVQLPSKTDDTTESDTTVAGEVSNYTAVGEFNESNSEPNNCPEFPPALIGRLKVNSTFSPTEEEAIEAAGDLVVNGCYEPSGCEPNQTVAIVIPYKNRYEHLITLMHHLHPILQRQSIRYCIFVPEQYDDGAFNKARVMNAGVLEILKEERYKFDCIIFHDVDMLLEDDRNIYKCESVPHHLSPAIDKFHYKLGYGTDFGGVGSVSVEQYKLVNGHSNRFYGWGGEDSDLELRFKLNKIRSVVNDPKFGRYKMIRHNHPWYFNPATGLGTYKRTRDTRRFDVDEVQERLLKQSDNSGLSTIKYEIKNVLKHKLFTKITIDIRTILVHNVSSSFPDHVGRVEAENSAITNDRLNTNKTQQSILGFGINGGSEFPNHGCKYKRFLDKTVNKTLGIKYNDTYGKTYNDLELAKEKCSKLALFCRAILEIKPGLYQLRSSAFMHELHLKYKIGRTPQSIFTEKHTDVSVYAKTCPEDIRHLQILEEPVQLSEEAAKSKSLVHEAQIDIQMFQLEDTKLYYSYEISTAHKAIMEDAEAVLNVSLGMYDSLSVPYKQSVQILDTRVESSYYKFLPEKYESLAELAENKGILRVKTPPLGVPLLPGCYVCKSAVKDQNGAVHMEWKWWFEVRGETRKLEEKLLKEYLPNAEVGSTKFTQGLLKKVEKELLHIKGSSKLSDDIMKIIFNHQAKIL